MLQKCDQHFDHIETSLQKSIHNNYWKSLCAYILYHMIIYIDTMDISMYWIWYDSHIVIIWWITYRCSGHLPEVALCWAIRQLRRASQVMGDFIYHYIRCIRQAEPREIGDADEMPLAKNHGCGMCGLHPACSIEASGWTKQNEHWSDNHLMLWRCQMTTVDLLFLQGQAMNVKSLLTLRGSIDRNGLLFTVQSKLLSVSLFQNCIRLG